MNEAFPGAMVDAPKSREYSYDLADPDDRHVVHAAIVGKADAIVTDDRRAGFRTSTVLVAADIEAVLPADFAANTVAAHPEAGARAVRALSQRMTRPPLSPLEVLDELRTRYQMIEVFDILAPSLSDAR